MKKESAPGITRKEFLRTSLAAAASLVAAPALASIKMSDVPVGACTGWENHSLLREAGCAFVEEGVGKILMPDKPEEEFRRKLDSFRDTRIPVRSYIYFLPGSLRAVGPDANPDAIVSWAAEAFRRARISGADYVVFGSGRSRQVPDGFDHASAVRQFVALCSQLAPIAGKHNVVLAVEQLNRGETNFLNTLQETADVVNAVGHPNFRMVCDIYHALKENDDPSLLVRYREHIVHCHIAEREERTAPGVKGDDFTAYFRALKKIRYKGGISIECRWRDMKSEIGRAVEVIQEQYRRA